jgi:hypothetical protein
MTDYRNPTSVSDYLWRIADLLDIADLYLLDDLRIEAEELRNLGSYLGLHGLPDPKAGAL